MGLSFLIYVFLEFVTIYFVRKIKKKILKISLGIIISIILIPIVFIGFMAISELDCYERKVTIIPTWKISSWDIGSKIYFQNDSLISVYYSIDSYKNDTTLRVYLIDKKAGKVICQLKNYRPKKTESVNYYLISTKKPYFSFGFDVDKYSLELTTNYKGYQISLNDWHKNIRASNNTYRYIEISKDDKVQKKLIISPAEDFIWDENALYMTVTGVLYKYSFDDLINQK